MIIRVPASSANVGPGFDALGVALSLHARVGLVDGDLPDGAMAADEHHPAVVSFRRAGGSGDIWLRSPIPVGRGLGFSGAVRVAGAALAWWQRTGEIDRAGVLAVAAALEGHADNVAASVHGGVVVTAGGRAVRVPTALDPAIVVWVPSFATSTDESRRTLPARVAFEDAVFNVGRAALLVAALAAGDVDALRTATEDRLHQADRFVRATPSRIAHQAMLDFGAWCAWLSGSGPTVAAMCPAGLADALAAALPVDGHAKVLRIDHDGAVAEAP